MWLERLSFFEVFEREHEVAVPARLHAALEVCPSVIDIGGRDAVTDALDIAHIAKLREQIPASFKVLIYNRLRSLQEAAAIAPLNPDGVLVNMSLLVQDGAIERLREIFGK